MKGFIDQKYKPVVFAFLMSLLMSCVMSLVISLNNVGFVNNILRIWLNAFGVSFVVALPTIFMVSPLVERLVNLFVITKNDGSSELYRIVIFRLP